MVGQRPGLSTIEDPVDYSLAKNKVADITRQLGKMRFSMLAIRYFVQPCYSTKYLFRVSQNLGGTDTCYEILNKV